MKDVINVFKNIWLNKNFFLLWSGQFISQTGDKFYGIAVVWWLLTKTNSPSVMGLFMVFSLLPGIIFGLFVGPYIDRWNRKWIIIGADILRGVIILLVTFLSVINMLEVPYLFISTILISLTSAFFDPTIQAVIPEIVEKKDLARANLLSKMIWGFSTVIGPVLGAGFVYYLGFSGVFLINGISYLLSAFFEGFINIKLNKKSVHNIDSSVWNDIKEVFEFIRRQKNISIIMSIIGIIHFFVGSLMVSLPVLARQLTGNGVQNLGYLETMLGLGLILGTLFISARKNKDIREKTLHIIIVVLGVVFLGLGTIRLCGVITIYPFLSLVIIIGGAIANASVYWQTLLQTNTNPDMAGRVFSISTVIGNASFPLAFGITGLLLDVLSVGLVTTICGIILIGVGIVFLCSDRG